MEPFLRREAVIVLIVFGSLSLTCIAVVLGAVWRKVRLAEMDASLKLEMIQRGMSAEEIKQVLEAGAASRQRRKESSMGRDRFGSKF